MKKVTLLMGLVCGLSQMAAAGPVDVKIKDKVFTANLPDGLRIELVNGDLKSPRFLAFASSGDLLVGSQVGLIYRLKAPYQKAEPLVDFDGYPHSVAFRKTAQGEELWVAETTGLYRTLYDPARTSYKRSDFTLVAPLPGGPGHNSRTVAVGPDQKVYVALGISGNCSDEFMSETYPFERRRGGILILDESKAKPVLVPFASGLRNPVGIAWEPNSGKLYATNNGPDHLGFDVPEEIFVQVNQGDFFGMPWYQNLKNGLTRDKCVASEPPLPMSKVKPALATLPSRSAPLGLAFPRDTDLGGRLKGQAVVAVHGSWGTPPSGGPVGSSAGRRVPRLAVVTLGEGGVPSKQEDFVSGFQDAKGKRWARPAGVAFGPDGLLYFSSDAEQEGLYRVVPTTR